MRKRNIKTIIREAAGTIIMSMVSVAFLSTLTRYKRIIIDVVK